MANSLQTLQIIALVVSAFLGAITAQLLSFYRERRLQLEELKNILYIISTLEEEEMLNKARSSGSFFWSLREELFENYKKNTLYLQENSKGVMRVIRAFPIDDNTTVPEFQETELKHAAASAYQSLDEIRPRQIFWQSLLGFVGLSEEKHADKLEMFIEEGLANSDESTPQVNGYYISSDRLQLSVVPPMVLVVLVVIELITGLPGIHSLSSKEYVEIISILVVFYPLSLFLIIPLVGKSVSD